MREIDSIAFLIAFLIVCAILICIVGFSYEAYLKWYINN